MATPTMPSCRDVTMVGQQEKAGGGLDGSTVLADGLTNCDISG